MKTNKEHYLEMLEDFRGLNHNNVPEENWKLDKVYDKEWFINDLNRIYSFYKYHQCKKTLQKDLILWVFFLSGCLGGNYK